MRLNRGYFILGTLVVLVLGSMFGLASQERVGFTPLKVGDPKQKPTHRTSLEDQSIGEKQASSESTHRAEIPLRIDEKISASQPISNVTISALQLDADHAIAEARYEQAAQNLQETVRLQQGSADARVLFKLAVCREALGDDFNALKGYQQAINSTHSQPLQTAARLGQCRVWTRKNKEVTARNELYSMLLNHRDSFSDRTSERISNQLALTSTQCSLTKRSASIVLSDQYIHLPQEEIAVEEVLSELIQNSAKQKPQTGNSTIIQNILQLDVSADSILFEVVSSPLPIRQLLEQLCKSVDLSISTDPETLSLLESKTHTLSIRGVPFSIVLDALLVPLDLSWTQEERMISIRRTENSSSEEQILQAERLLKYAITAAPDHSLAPYCHIALATLKHERGDFQAALREYERLLNLYPGVPFASEIWVNIGKCRLKLKQPDALAAFHMAVDLGTGGEVEAVAHAYAGRIHLAQDSPQQAFVPLQRAADITTDSQLLLEIQLLKAAARYFNSQAKLGLEGLSLCAANLQTERSQNQFTVLALLLQSQASTTQQIREREAALLLSALANLKDDDLFGEHWNYLLARAYQELGFQSEVERLRQEFQHLHSNLPLSTRFRELLSKKKRIHPHELDVNPDPIVLEQFFANEKQSPTTDEAMIQYCQHLLETKKLSNEERIVTLQKLGAIYQRQGNHQLAIQCYTNSYSPTENITQ